MSRDRSRLQSVAVQPEVVLASSSANRRDLLGRLIDGFRVCEPVGGEPLVEGETGRERALRLSRHKAGSVRTAYPSHLIIGSDQVAECGGRVLHKPGTPERARADLEWASGRSIHFWTGLALLDTRNGLEYTAVDHTRVWMRTLSAGEIARYLEADQPWSCAASFRAESRGPSLWHRLATRDPTALVGLPLIRLAHFLRQAGYPVP